MTKFIVPASGLALVVTLASLLIGVIVLRSPDTRGNLWETVPPDYARTDLSVIGSRLGEMELEREANDIREGNSGLVRTAYAAFTADPGRAAFLRLGCATCHGMDARGGPVGPSLAGASPESVKRMVGEGRGGMPAYAGAQLDEAGLAALASYFQGLETVRPDPEKIAALQRLTYDASVPKDVLLKGKAAIRRSCGACHAQPGTADIMKAFGSDAAVASLVADMVPDANLNMEDAEAIAHYMLAVRNGADPLRAP